MWKKRKAIEGVSAASMVALKATLFEEEQRAKLQGKAQSAEKKTKAPRRASSLCTHVGQVKSIKDTLGVANKGLAERQARDELHKAPNEMTPDEIERRLREKAELYQRIKRGEVSVNDEDDEQGYLVDFVKKGYLEQEEEERHRGEGGESKGPSYMHSEDLRREQERLNWERSVEQEAETEKRKRQSIATIDQIREQTLKGRAKAEELRRRRARIMEQRLQRIKEGIEKRTQEGEKGAEDEVEDEEGESDASSVAEPYDPFDEGDEDEQPKAPAAGT